MKNIPTGAKFNSFADLANAMGIKSRKQDEVKLQAQREKFCKCFKCKGQMEWIQGSNILVCKSVLTNAEGNNIMNKDGSCRTCGNIRYLDEKGVSYASKLFS